MRAPIQTREALLAETDTQREAHVASHLAGIVAELVHRPDAPVPADSSLAAIGLDSLATVELVERIQLDFGVALPLADLIEAPGLAAIYRNVLSALYVATLPDPDRA